jgi:hypothetical protein
MPKRPLAEALRPAHTIGVNTVSSKPVLDPVLKITMLDLPSDPTPLKPTDQVRRQLGAAVVATL